jgi:hypothetical protein
MGCMGDAATGKEGRHRGGGWSPGNEGQMGTTACAGEMRWGTHTHRRRGWDMMAVAWPTCRPRAAGWSGRGDHTLGAPVQKVRNGDRRNTCQARGGRCAAQQRSVPYPWWTPQGRELLRHPLGLAGGRQAPPMALALCTTGRKLARPLRGGRNAQAAIYIPPVKSRDCSLGILPGRAASYGYLGSPAPRGNRGSRRF